jgi:hypothetical protein
MNCSLIRRNGITDIARDQTLHASVRGIALPGIASMLSPKYHAVVAIPPSTGTMVPVR